MDDLINRVAQSGLKTIDLEELYVPGDRVMFDIRPLLFQEQILREKEFREQLKQTNWTAFTGKFVAITCSTDAIIPTWAYMLIAINLQPFAQKIVFGSIEKLEEVLFFEQISKLDFAVYKDARVVIKGCSKIQVPVSAYVEITQRLRPLAKSIMYGEPCSTVPLYKSKG